jgi:hypothetical protein
MMKIEEIALVAGAVWLLSQLMAKGTTTLGTGETQATGCFGSCGGVNPAPPVTNERTSDTVTERVVYKTITQEIPVYGVNVYGTSRPVTPSEAGVSEGVPYPGITIPLAPGTVSAPRFAGDTQVLTQCPRGQLQGGSPSTMNYLLTSQTADAKAWRARFCD